MCIYNQHFTEINTDLDQFDSNSLAKNAPYYMYNTCACVWVITKFSINVIKSFLYFWYTDRALVKLIIGFKIQFVP